MISPDIWPLPGGIHPPEQKSQSTATSIAAAPLPKRLILPLNQHLGAPAEPVVAVGERVLKGQLIAAASSNISAPVHAPSSGIVSFIGAQPYPHASGLEAEAVVIETDGLEQWIALAPLPDYLSVAPAVLLEKIRDAGISGLGGAGFPTAVKLAGAARQTIHTLIINGSECEPYITADDMLMRERTAELLSGIDILVHLTQAQQVLIGIEDNKPEAIAAVRAALGQRSYQLKVIPTKYPSGGEKQLIQILTGAEVPSAGLPADIGVLCHNVGTCVAVHEAVIHGKPLISRIATLTGAALQRPQNVEALLGTPINELLAFAGLNASQLDRLIMGGPMMGVSLTDAHAPLIKTTNCLLASTAEELPEPAPALPCIRCGDCEEVCPVSLLPQQLHFFALGQQHAQLHAHNLFDCIECGACAYVCPSNIPLVQYYRAAKGEIRELKAKQTKAEHSRLRFEQRQERLRRAEEQKEAERQARVARASQVRSAPNASIPTSKPEAPHSGPSDELKKLKIAASMAQVALKKAEKQLANHNTAELQKQVEQLQEAAQNAQQQLDKASAEAAAAAPAVASTTAISTAPSGDEAALKKAKIEAAMLRAQLRKLENLSEPDSTQQAELATVREQCAAAEQRLAQLQPAPSVPAPSASSAALKQAKIDAAMLRVQVRKLENLAEPTAEQHSSLLKLREELAAAQQQLSALSAPPAPAMAPSPGAVALKQAKIALALQRSELKKAQDAAADEATLEALRSALSAAEQALHQAEDASGKPPPQLVRTDKRPIDEVSRGLKTELAFARADLRKLERDPNSAPETLTAAQARIASIEQQLHEHQARL
ncbi:electron transport complex subunit RsxC [Pseudomonas sp. 5P_3.1_Bac2]|nr:electron transport complex subunit RsxC [Pseudomonas sp. 5P_3.1_Bac2]MCU1716071.1 electron transport complex subunit RsxC [Pseudomonas sp. 5P_3.1_Bac2]